MPSTDAQKTRHIASRQTFHRDAGQTGWKTGRPGKNGTGGNPNLNNKRLTSVAIPIDISKAMWPKKQLIQKR